MILAVIAGLSMLDALIIGAGLSMSTKSKFDAIRSGETVSLSKQEETEIMDAIASQVDTALTDPSENPLGEGEWGNPPKDRETDVEAILEELIEEAEEMQDTQAVALLRRLLDLLRRYGVGEEFYTELSHIVSALNNEGIAQSLLGIVTLIAGHGGIISKLHDESTSDVIDSRSGEIAFSPNNTEIIDSPLGKSYAFHILSEANRKSPLDPCKWLRDKLRDLRVSGNQDFWDSNILNNANEKLSISNGVAVAAIRGLIKMLGCQEIGYGPYSGVPF